MGLSVRVGPTGEDSSPPNDRRVCIALRVELDFGKLVVWGTDRHVADLRGATNECL